MPDTECKLTVAALICAFADQVDAMFNSDRPVGTIVLPFAYASYADITLLGGNLSAHGGYIHRRRVHALSENETRLPKAESALGPDVRQLARVTLGKLGYGAARVLTVRSAPLPAGLNAPHVIAPTELFPLPMYRSRKIIQPNGFTFSHSR